MKHGGRAWRRATRVVDHRVHEPGGDRFRGLDRRSGLVL
jgi:hypothetical protein